MRGAKKQLLIFYERPNKADQKAQTHHRPQVLEEQSGELNTSKQSGQYYFQKCKLHSHDFF